MTGVCCNDLLLIQKGHYGEKQLAKSKINKNKNLSPKFKHKSKYKKILTHYLINPDVNLGPTKNIKSIQDLTSNLSHTSPKFIY